MTAVQPQTTTAPTPTPCQLREALEAAWQDGFLGRPISLPPGLSDLGQVACTACYRRGQVRRLEEVERRAGDEDEGTVLEEETRS